MIIKFKQVPLKKTNMDLHDPYVPLYYLCMMSFSLKRTGARLLTNKDDITFNIISWKMEFFAGIWHYGHELNWKKFFVQKHKKQKYVNSISIYDLVGWICLIIFVDLDKDCTKVFKNKATEFEARNKFKNISELTELQLNYLSKRRSELARNRN